MMLHDIFTFFLSIDQHLITLLTTHGSWAYAILFLIIFCETGLLVTPFLPGDSLLFIAGGLSSQTGLSLNVFYLFLLLVLASWLGNQVNYQLGRWCGPRVFSMKNKWFFSQAYLKKTHDFYEVHGKSTIILARFLPIIRTFAPFVAGVANMNYQIFTFYNFMSALLWIGSLLLCGYLLGHVSFVQLHLNIMIYGIVFLSILPGLVSYCRQKRTTSRSG
jgi:membrane-associated protein